MRAPGRLLTLLLPALVLAGCSAGADDPFAYTRKPLYTGYFDLDPLAGGKTDSQEFRVEDGSIGRIHVQVWINATAGRGQVDLVDPSGRTALTTTSSTTQSYPLTLGVWKVVVRGEPDGGALAGHVGVLVTRG